MKTRMVVHIALNAKNERVNMLVSVSGQLIPSRYCTMNSLTDRTAMEWLGNNFCASASIANWKSDVKNWYKAVRLQRVTFIGESK